MKKYLSWVFLISCSLLMPPLYADEVKEQSTYEPPQQDPVRYRTNQEEKQNENPFSISMYEPTYLLPFYYSGVPNSLYTNNTPNNQGVKNMEISFQLSLKAPIWEHFYGGDNALYFAYTQLSFWQAYNSSPFFRETNYQPELFFSTKLDKLLFKGWRMKFVNVGFVHQSNGCGGQLERSWDRVYADFTFSRDQWMVGIRPWYAIPDNSLKSHNPDITQYLGHGRVLIAYKYHRQTFALESYNMENSLGRTSAKVSWSFPLIKKLRGYVQGFSGYGQSLLEYNHHSNSIGVGIALSDWI